MDEKKIKTRDRKTVEAHQCIPATLRAIFFFAFPFRCGDALLCRTTLRQPCPLTNLPHSFLLLVLMSDDKLGAFIYDGRHASKQCHRSFLLDCHQHVFIVRTENKNSAITLVRKKRVDTNLSASQYNKLRKS